MDLRALRTRRRGDIDGEKHEVGPGDFMRFPPPVAHHLRNPFDEDLVYLAGGETMDVAYLPRLGKRMIRRGHDVEIYDASDVQGFGPLTEDSGSPDSA